MKSHAFLLGTLFLAAWAVEVFDFLTPWASLDRFGIRPRSVSGLIGIVVSPFLHGGFGHLISNSVPFLVLGGVVLLGGRRVFIAVSIFVVVLGGFAVWLLAPSGGIHVGASGVVFGYLGFLLARGVFEKSWKWFLISIVILILYGGLLWGILPSDPHVSWQGHLFGFGAGVIAAWAMFPHDGRQQFA